MKLETGLMTRSKYTKAFFPCSENAADVNPVCAVNGATYSPNGVALGNGLKVVIDSQVATVPLTGGTIPDIAEDESFILFCVAGGISNSAIGLGDATSGSRAMFLEAPKTLNVVTDKKTATLADITLTDAAGIHGYSIVCDRGGNVEFVEDGTVNSSVAAPSGAITWGQEAIFPTGDVYEFVLFVFSDGIPSDYLEALPWMAEKAAVGQKIIWTPWDVAA